MSARVFSQWLLALGLFAVPVSAALAHQPRGLVLQESFDTEPAEKGYVPPDPASLGGPFKMVDHTGRVVTQDMLRGKISLMFFGFVGCREACPTALDKLPALMEQLGADAARVQPIFVDVSMDKTDVRALAQFVSNFHPSLIGLTGSRAERFDIVRVYKVRREYKHNAYSRRETGPRLDHSTYFYIVDPEGRTKSYFYHTLTPAEMAAAIREWM